MTFDLYKVANAPKDKAVEWLRVHKLDWPPCKCDAPKDFGRITGADGLVSVVICSECTAMCPAEVYFAMGDW